MLPMAPRRNNSSNSIVHQQQIHHIHSQQQTTQLLLGNSFYSDSDPLEPPAAATTSINHIITTNNNIASITAIMSPMQTSNSSSVNSNNNNNSNHNNCAAQQQQFMHCCFPNGDCLKMDTLIAVEDVSGCVRVLCNNENCNVGQYMHRECFETWEQTVLVTLKSIGRARSWSDRQRSQNLWTKKGYDLVYKACGCKCGRGHIRKDLEWSAPPALQAGQLAKNVGSAMNGNYVNGVVVGGGSSNSANTQRITNGIVGNDDAEASKKKKKRNRNNQKPTLALTPLNPSGYHPNSQQQQHQHQQQHQQQHQHQQAAQNGHNNAAANASINNSSANNATAVNSHNNVCNSSINLSPNPNVGVIGSGLHSHNQQQQLQQQQDQQNSTNSMSNTDVTQLTNGHVGGNVLGLDLQARAGSLSSSGSSSPSASQSSDLSISPIHHNQQQNQQQQQQQLLQLQQQYQQSLLQNGLSKSILSGINGCLAAGGNNGPQLLTASKVQQQQQQSAAIVANGIKNLSCIDQQQLVQQQKNKEVEIYSERVRSTSGCNGIFSRRLDFSSFNLLPKTRLNSYQVKIEDEGNHGNDETRLFILSSLAQSQMSRVACILCEEPMLVFDRYPLVDGSFFLSPKQHSTGCIEVKYEGRALYLTCVCMGCLDGTATNRVINCRFCGEIWDGSNLVLGTMYAYDIFAAMPCCAERLKCNNCFKLLLHPQQRLNFYSDYSHCVTCPYCATQDTHFVKPLSYCYNKSAVARHQLIA